MKFIKKVRPLGNLFDSEHEYWELQGGFIATVSAEHNDNIVSILINDNDKNNYLPPVERCRKEEQFARKIQKKINNIKIDYGIDAVYMICSKDQLMDVLTEIERHINNQDW